MPYEVLLKKAHELVDAASPEKIEWVVGVLEGEDSAKKLRSEKTLSLEEALAFAKSVPHNKKPGKWNREDAYDRGL